MRCLKVSKKGSAFEGISGALKPKHQRQKRERRRGAEKQREKRTGAEKQSEKEKGKQSEKERKTFLKKKTHGEKVGHVVAERAVVGVLLDRHDLDRVVPGLFSFCLFQLREREKRERERRREKRKEKKVSVFSYLSFSSSEEGKKN